MPITKTRTRRYMALCEVSDCDWTTGPHGLRVVVSQRLKTHLLTVHGLHLVDDITKEQGMVKHASTELPQDEGLDKLSNHGGSLVAVARGWTFNPAYSTQFGPREAIVADVYVYDGKAWKNLGERENDVATQTPIFFKTVIRQLQEAGDEDDFGGILSQNVPGRKNNREWAILPATGAAAKALDKFDGNAF